MIITKENLNVINEESLALGKKAKYLLSLYNISKGMIFDIPDFAIIPGNAIQKYNKKISITDTNFSDAINFMKPDQDIARQYNEFVYENYKDLSRAFELTRSDFNPRIRTSLCLDVNYKDSFAGVNHTIDCEDDSKDAFLFYAIPQAIAGVYKPYSNWYLKRRNLEHIDRSCSIMFSKFIPDTYAGIAHISLTEANVVLGLNSPEKADVLSFNFCNTQVNLEHKRLFNALKFIRNKMAEKEIEVEFLLDNKDASKLNIMQIRGVENNENLSFLKDDKHYFFDHKLIDLQNRKNQLDELNSVFEKVSDPTNYFFIINHENRKNIKYLDATSLILKLNEKYPKSYINVLGCYESVMPSTHLMTALREDKNINFKITSQKNVRNLLNNPIFNKLKANRSY